MSATSIPAKVVVDTSDSEREVGKEDEQRQSKPKSKPQEEEEEEEDDDDIYCEICSKSQDERKINEIILCDGCDGGFHMKQV